MMGLGAMVGTGVFVSIGIAAGIAGPAVILAVVIAAGVAMCNALSSAQLAASHAVSGGTYEYGYRYLAPWLGFTAGWMFMIAKSASAATAALGFAGYLLNAGGFAQELRVPLGLAGVTAITLVVAAGMRRTNIVNVVIVSITVLALVFFVIAGSFVIDADNFTPFLEPGDGWQSSLFHATALMFVAYTGYGRIATLGEEVRDPPRIIPLAIVITMIISTLLYLAVAVVGIGAIGAEGLQQATQSQAAPLAGAAQRFSFPYASRILAFAAITAMLGVLLNLLLGLSRVLLAMGRRGDMPVLFSRIETSSGVPLLSVLCVGGFIAFLVLVGDVKTTWSFSAFTVLVYYALTNLAALQLPESARLYPRWVAVLGLAACLFLAFQVETATWIAGLGLIVLGLGWRIVMRRLSKQ